MYDEIYQFSCRNFKIAQVFLIVPQLNKSIFIYLYY